MLEQAKQEVRRRIPLGSGKVPAAELTRDICARAHIDRHTVRRAIRDLITAGWLRFTYEYGTSFVQVSFERPVRISPRIVLKPPHMHYASEPDEIVIDLAPGAAFGSGAHPTTALCLKALERVMGGFFRNDKRATALVGLDVGTGSGVLAVAQAKLGIGQVLGLDVDPCAIWEAAANVALNRLSDCITISAMPLDRVGGTYDMITANLALPTLTQIAPILCAKMARGAVLIVSGFKKEASAALKDTLVGHGLTPVRQYFQQQWGCLMLCLA
ncbi:MAG: 50S ribosomal protein L11 methyltransferase [Deltaproteobacteria bacterium]|nr:50S ribosomal protein L11 methyltransferase [Deltaproteobacteria bacterium]